MTKQFILTRIARNDMAVYGLLSIVENGVIIFVCRTIENRDKIFPAGTYPVRLEHSPRFGRNLWELYSVSGRSEIKIHVANYYDQLDGCIGVGAASAHLNMDNIPDITESAKTLAALHNRMVGMKETTIRVTDSF